jgi:hypothetical protein
MFLALIEIVDILALTSDVVRCESIHPSRSMASLNDTSPETEVDPMTVHWKVGTAMRRELLRNSCAAFISASKPYSLARGGQYLNQQVVSDCRYDVMEMAVNYRFADPADANDNKNLKASQDFERRDEMRHIDGCSSLRPTDLDGPKPDDSHEYGSDQCLRKRSDIPSFLFH